MSSPEQELEALYQRGEAFEHVVAALRAAAKAMNEDIALIEALGDAAFTAYLGTCFAAIDDGSRVIRASDLLEAVAREPTRFAVLRSELQQRCTTPDVHGLPTVSSFGRTLARATRGSSSRHVAPVRYGTS